jgi:hypothetical protein
MSIFKKQAATMPCDDKCCTFNSYHFDLSEPPVCTSHVLSKLRHCKVMENLLCGGYQPIPSAEEPRPPVGGSAVIHPQPPDYAKGYRDGYSDAVRALGCDTYEQTSTLQTSNG